MREPTSEELSRDLAADWEVIQKATAGEWCVCSGNQVLANCGNETSPVDLLGYRRTSYDGDGEGYVINDGDAEFIARSRQGWEAAVVLANCYKAECERLRERLEFVEVVFETFRKHGGIMKRLAEND